MAFDFDSLKDILACPKCHSKLVLDGDRRLVCVNESCRLAFDVLEDIPVMLVDEATELSVDDWNEVMSKTASDSNGAG